MKTKNTLTKEEEYKLKLSKIKKEPIEEMQYAGWVVDLKLVADVFLGKSIIKPYDYPPAVFWIRLHGAITEVRAFYIKDEMNQAERRGRNNYRRIKEVNVLFDKLLNKLSEEEIVVIDNYRQTNCHAIQSLYDLGIKKGKLRDTYTVRAIQKTIKIDDVTNILHNYHKRYPLNSIESECQKVKEIAIKIENELNQLYELLHPLKYWSTSGLEMFLHSEWNFLRWRR